MPIKRFLSLSNITGAVFIVLNVVGILHHELWADEMHHWLLAQFSNSFIELIHNSRYDGHPLVWDGMLFIIARFTGNPTWMQVLNLIISSITALLILNAAPFPLAMRILIVFGYFPFYEYADISRNYSIGLLLIVCCCILYRKRYTKYLLFSILLGLLANIHLLCLFISIAFFIALLTDYIFYASPSAYQKRMALIGLLIYCLCIMFSLLQIIPPPETYVAIHLHELVSFHRIGGALSILTKSFLPMPDVRTINWWNTNWFVDISPLLNAILTLLILITSFLILFKRPTAFLLFYLSFFAVAFFVFLFQIYAVRYYGFVFISFIAAIWIGNTYEPPVNFNRVLKSFLYTVLIIQVIAGFTAYCLDLKKPFSQGKDTVTYLQATGLSNCTVAVSSCNAGPPISGYLDKKVFYPQINQWGSFCLWNLPFEKVSEDSALTNAKQLCISYHRSIVMVFNEPLNKTVYKDPATQIRFIKDFTGSTVASENYFIYLMTPKK